MRRTLIGVGLLWSYTCAAQLISYPSYVGDGQSTERLISLSGNTTNIHRAISPYTFEDLAQVVHTIDSIGLASSAADRQAIANTKIRLGLTERRSQPDRSGFTGWLSRTFYRQSGYALAIKVPSFELYANPVLLLSAGQQGEGSSLGGPTFNNTRGVSIHGSIDNKVYFSSSIYENQLRLRSWEREWSRAYQNRVPGAGFAKSFDPLLFDVAEARDFIQARGEIGLRATKHIHLRVGHGNPRIGSGIRSMALDDFVDPYLLRTNRYAHLAHSLPQCLCSVSRRSSDFCKFSQEALCDAHIVRKARETMEVGLTETIVFAREQGFDAQYLNPNYPVSCYRRGHWFSRQLTVFSSYRCGLRSNAQRSTVNSPSMNLSLTNSFWSVADGGPTSLAGSLVGECSTLSGSMDLPFRRNTTACDLLLSDTDSHRSVTRTTLSR